MTNKLQKRHGTALITWINRHILTMDIPDDAGLGTGQATRLQVASRMLIAFTLHLNNQPITCTAIVDGGGGSETKVNYTLAYLSRLKILTATAKLASHGAGRVHHYSFSDSFTATILRVHTGIGTDDI